MPDPTDPADPGDPFDPFADPFGDLDAMLAAWEAGEMEDGTDQAALNDSDRLRAVARSVALADRGTLDEPPPQLRANVLAAVRAESLATAPTDGVFPGPASDGAVSPPPAASGIDELAIRRQRRTQRPWWAKPGLIGAAAAVLMVALVFGLRPGSTKRDVAFAVELVPAPEGLQTDATGRAELIRTKDGLVMRIVAKDLPPTKPGYYYECWYVGPSDSATKQDRFAIGTFTTSTGDVDVEWRTAVDWRKYPKIGVTLEPDDGNPARTGQKVLVGKPSATIASATATTVISATTVMPATTAGAMSPMDH